MVATLDPSQVSESQSRSAAEMGLASLLLGCLLAVMVFFTLQT